MHRGDLAAQVFYTSIDNFLWSDHRPVVALYQNKIYKSIETKKMEVLKKAKETFRELLRKKAPKAQIDRTAINIQGVKYGIPSVELLTISNVGESIIEYKITRPRFGWITAIQMSGVLLPGESVQVSVSILVTTEEAQALHAEPDYLRTSIEVKITGGQTFNVEVTGSYIKSCFGAALELLNSVYEGFATLDPNLTARELISKCPCRLVVPKEIYALTKWLMRNGAKTEKLFVSAGNEAEKAMIRDCLDANKEIPAGADAYSVADTLVELIESIPAIIPVEIITDTAKEYENSADKNCKVCELFLMKLPSEVTPLVLFMLSFYKQLLEYADSNGLSVEIVVRVLAACLVKMDASGWDQQLSLIHICRCRRYAVCRSRWSP
eukprot:TRINITY_DN12444_c0_g1_i4.p1 TRINITY_DN12444_c0_g1~~TRINITY_DN12444_c0_g1_i4.p1  ORF type:complete len:380 (+),score=80.42 TRINITY_DN12444_c0_g1_i4:410-1549(+)